MSIDANVEEILRQLIRITTGRAPVSGEDVDVTLALLRAHPTTQEEITDLWKQVDA